MNDEPDEPMVQISGDPTCVTILQRALAAEDAGDVEGARRAWAQLEVLADRPGPAPEAEG